MKNVLIASAALSACFFVMDVNSSEDKYAATPTELYRCMSLGNDRGYCIETIPFVKKARAEAAAKMKAEMEAEWQEQQAREERKNLEQESSKLIAKTNRTEQEHARLKEIHNNITIDEAFERIDGLDDTAADFMCRYVGAGRYDIRLCSKGTPKDLIKKAVNYNPDLRFMFSDFSLKR